MYIENCLMQHSRLLAIVKKYREGANKDIRRFTEDIEKLCRRWDK